MEDAIGMILCHDITKIIPGEFKGRAFQKGHVIQKDDIPELLKLGKDHIYVWELKKGFVHEDDAAIRIAQAIKGDGISLSEPKEGKVSLIAEFNGLITIDEKLLFKINSIEQIVVATITNAKPVKKGEQIAGVRVIPLSIREKKINRVEQLEHVSKTVSLAPYRPLKVGVITTGNEVFHGRITDRFGPVVREKADSFGCEVMRHTIVPDDLNLIAQVVKDYADSGVIELILITGGMSVDPDDVTPGGVKKAGADIVTYGAPVLPGAMLLVAYLGKIPILGLPGCVMYHKTTVFDLILPLVLTGQHISRRTVAKLGKGGLCLQCEECRYPTCSFGTGA